MQLHCDSKNIDPQGNEGRREILMNQWLLMSTQGV